MGGIDYWQGTIVNCRRPGKASSVTEAQSHDKGRIGRHVTGFHISATGIKNKSVTGSMEKGVGTEDREAKGILFYISPLHSHELLLHCFLPILGHGNGNVFTNYMINPFMNVL